MTEKTFSTPMGQIHYWTAEAPGRPWLVFLPGLTADCRLFDKQTQALSPRFSCLVWDAPAHGASRPFTLAFSMEDLTCWLHAILEREGIKKPLLVGQSMGGCIAQSYRKAYPESAAGLVTIDAPPLGRRYYTRAELWLLKHTKWMYRSIPWGLLQKCGVAGTSESPYGHSLMEKMLKSYQKEEYCALATHGYKLLAQAVEAYGESTLACPALLLCGEKDGAGSCRRYDKAWAKAEGLPLVWVPEAGHNANTDAPDFVNSHIEGFARKLFL